MFYFTVCSSLSLGLFQLCIQVHNYIELLSFIKYSMDNGNMASVWSSRTIYGCLAPIRYKNLNLTQILIKTLATDL